MEQFLMYQRGLDGGAGTLVMATGGAVSGDNGRGVLQPIYDIRNPEKGRDNAAFIGAFREAQKHPELTLPDGSVDMSKVMGEFCREQMKKEGYLRGD